MKAKHLSLAIATLLAAGGSWFWSAWRSHAFQKSSMGVGFETPHGRPGQMLRPPDPTRKFWELTPEQRVQQARQPNGVGG